MFVKKYLKWISTFLVLVGILLTNLNIYPINIYNNHIYDCVCSIMMN